MEKAKVLTKEERIAARRARIAKLSSKGDNQSGATQQDEDEGKEQRSSKAQIAKSRDIVDQAKDEALDAVSQIKIESDEAHNQKRREERMRRQKRDEVIQKEIQDSIRQNEELQEQWISVLDIDVPHQLAEQIATQQEACQELLAKLDCRIQSLLDEVKEKDDFYDEQLGEHNISIQTFITSMREQFRTLLGTYKSELERIESSFIDERKELFEAHRTEINHLFNKRRKMELSIMETKQQTEEKFKKELTQIRSEGAEKYNALKISMENTIQLLEQQLEDMRATYQLNSEKLEYNHRVLKEMDTENKQTVKHHKQKLKRLKEAITSTSARYTAQESQFKAENNELTEDFRRITSQFKDLQKKFRHFQVVDQQKYDEVWEMNEEGVLEVVQKVIKADELIHKQILGYVDDPNYTPPQLPPHPHSKQASSTEDAETGRPVTQRHISRFNDDQVHDVLLMLASEARFLVDPATTASIQNLPDEERTMYTVDNVLSVLGIVDREDLDELVAKFYDENSGQKTTQLEETVHVVKEFVSNRQQAKTRNASEMTSGKADIASSQKDEKKRKAEREYWKNLGDILSDDRAQTWNAVEDGLNKYYHLLQERSNLISETSGLAEQNRQLRELVEKYMHDPVNYELQIPPNRLVRASDLQ